MVLITQSGPETLPIGAPAPDFSLPGVDGHTYTLAGLSSGNLLVLNFTCNHCPYAQAYEDRFMDLVRAFTLRGVTFAAINANDATRYPDDSVAKMRERSASRAFNFPYLRDESQQTARAYGASPHQPPHTTSRTPSPPCWPTSPPPARTPRPWAAPSSGNRAMGTKTPWFISTGEPIRPESD